MLEQIRKRWHALKSSAPGRRFQDRYRHTRSRRDSRSVIAPIVRLVAGTTITLLGVVMLFTPGPGVLLLAIGASLIGSESLAVARLLDRAELRARHVLAAAKAWRHRIRNDGP